VKTIELVTTKNVEPQALAHLVGQEVKVTFLYMGKQVPVEIASAVVLFADHTVLALKNVVGYEQSAETEIPAEWILKVEVL